VEFNAERIRGQGNWFTLVFDAAPGTQPNQAVATSGHLPVLAIQ
jgi:hypothetical protein